MWSSTPPCSATLITRANWPLSWRTKISHVTQRHLARAMEDQKRNAPLTWVGALGSILLAMASPQAGMAALTGTLAGTQQGMISFTRQNEERGRPDWHSGSAALGFRPTGHADVYG
ncbi:exported zinc metalloprotease YfgC [Klebsiella pneumoniae]|uniref:Exported zinc metalloprotease YfgC n=1 Tax=Klebsiella pneumoniae TaxID=573 RepID=A0A3S4H5T7_KLEPN|nr:exported zinc metalloprotease YfgC [Klebsiella pneumoniae]